MALEVLEDAVVNTSVDVETVRIFHATHEGESRRLYIGRDDRTEPLIEQVNALVGKRVRMTISGVSWQVGNRKGVKYFLRQIEEMPDASDK